MGRGMDWFVVGWGISRGENGGMLQVFGDERLTAVLLDRLAHKSHILEFVGESHRFRQRMQQEVRQTDDP